MANIPKFTDDIAYVSKLGDNPNTDNGLNSQQLKAVFDAAALAIQNYLNTYLIPAFNQELSSETFLKRTGGTMKGDIAMDGHRVTGLADPVADTDAVSNAFMAAALKEITAESIGAVAAKDLAAKSVDGIHMDTVKAPGLYFGSTMQGAAVDGRSVFRVEAFSDAWLTQEQKRILDDGTVQLFVRSFYNGNAWSPWQPVLTNILPDSMLGTTAPETGVRNQLHFVEVG